jgi:flavin reductase (DIM6/NTAB) family NADH-FMN oxidoreductase RutF
MIRPALVADAADAASSVVFKEAMRQLPGGVAIITAGKDKEISGMTVSSLLSLSIDPPTVLVSINRKSFSWPLIERSGFFAASVLASDHLSLAERFSGRHGLSGTQRFDESAWTTLTTGAPVLRDALAAFDCEVENIVPHHSHSIVIGRAVRAIRLPGRGALAYWNGHYVATEGEDDIRRLEAVCFPFSRGFMEI